MDARWSTRQVKCGGFFEKNGHGLAKNRSGFDR
jgi:hypothetical protein